MRARPVPRRTFLAGAAVAVGAACSSGDGDDQSVDASATTRVTGPQPITGVLASQDLYAGGEQRFAFGVLKLRGETDYALVRGEQVLLSFAPLDERPGPPQAATFHAEGLPPDRGVYVTRASFGTAGLWEATIAVGDLRGTLPFEVGKESKAPKPGDRAPDVKTPTTEDAAGVDPICTRTPACPFHEVSIGDALEGGLPTVVMFSTPAYCTSRVCGPVLDLLVDLAPEFEGRANFVHVEVWKDRSTREASPGMQAWGLQTEPWLFGVDADAEIVTRLDGAFDAGEVRAAVEATVGVPPDGEDR